MTVADKVSFGIALPHRGLRPLSPGVVAEAARQAEALGYHDIWVTENTIDAVFSYDPIVILSYAAALTSSIGLGVSVLVLPTHSPIRLAHQLASLDRLSGGRVIAGVGMGRRRDYRAFSVPSGNAEKRFVEGIEIVKKAWSGESVSHRGDAYSFDNARIGATPSRSPRPPIWMGGYRAQSLRRAVQLGDGWMGAGGQSRSEFGESVATIRSEMDGIGRDPESFVISKRVFVSIDERRELARRELQRWFHEAYGTAELAESCGVYGGTQVVLEQLEDLIDLGAEHLVLNPVDRYSVQADALAEICRIGPLAAKRKGSRQAES